MITLLLLFCALLAPRKIGVSISGQSTGSQHSKPGLIIADRQNITVVNISVENVLENVTITRLPILYDIDQDGIYELIVPSNDTLIVYKYNSTSGRFEEVWKTWIGKIYELTLSPGHKNKTEGYVISTSPMCADLNGDGNIEIAIGCGKHLFILDENGTVIREYETDYEILNLTVMDFDLDGALEIVMRVKSTTNSIAHTDFYAFDGKVDYLSVSKEPKGTIKAIDFPLSGKVESIYRLIYVSKDTIVTRYQNGTTAPSIIYSKTLWDDIMLDIVKGNFSGGTTGVEFVVILKDNNITFVNFPDRNTILNVSIPELFNVSNEDISADKIAINPLVADFDNDTLDEVFLWANIRENQSIICFLGIKNLTNKEYDYARANITIINATPIYGLTINTENGTIPLVLLSNGSILYFKLNETNISIMRLSEPVENATLLLVGNIDSDLDYEILAISNTTIYLVNITANSTWISYCHDMRNTNYINEPPDWDMDGYPDSLDSAWNDSDIDDDWANDYTEYLLGTNISDNDSDDDKLGDGWERRYNLDPLDDDTNNNAVIDWREDMDDDNITNLWEWKNMTNPKNNDTDNDGLLDNWEIIGNFTNVSVDNTTINITTKTSPISKDTDHDYIPDLWETINKLNATNSTDALLDNDDDGLTNLGEYLYETDPYDEDTDDDELYDGYEVYYGLDPTNPQDPYEDKDEDGLNNYIEFIIGTDPTLNDTDKDGLPDGWEWTYGLNPLDSADNETDVDDDGLTNIEEYNEGTNPRKSDTDGDTMPDGWEVEHNFDPTDPDDGYQDADLDGLINKDEYLHGTDPLNADTDGDGLSDGVEVSIGTDPLNADTDGDGLSDGEEIASGRDPLSPEGKHIPMQLILIIIFLGFVVFAIIFTRFRFH